MGVFSHIRKFDKNTSVFKEWNSDHDLIIKDCLKIDLELSKLHKIKMTEEDKTSLIELIATHFESLKHIVICL